MSTGREMLGMITATTPVPGRIKREPPPAYDTEILRAGVARLKQLFVLRNPPDQMPADSFLEDAVRDILMLGQAKK